MKELRLAGVAGIAATNLFLPAFLADYNRRFGKMPRNPKDLHRPLAAHDSLDDALAWREERTVTANLTLRYNKVMFLLEPNEITRAAARQRVVVHDYPDGRLAIRWNGVELPYRAFDKMRTVDQAAIVDNKRLGAALAYAQQLQAERGRSRNLTPRRSGQAAGIMAP